MGESNHDVHALREENRQLRARVAELEHDALARMPDVAGDTPTEEPLRAVMDVMDSAPGGFVACDRSFNILDMNVAAVGILQLNTKGEGLGKNLSALVPGIVSSARMEEYKRVISTGDPFVVDDVSPGGKSEDARFTVTAFKMGEGIGFLTRDIMDRRRAEAALTASETRFRALAESLPGAVFTYDVNEDESRTPAYVGPGFEELVGQATAERIRSGDVNCFFELIHPDDLQKMRDTGQFEPGFSESVDHEYRLCTESGSQKWVRAIAKPVRLNGAVLRWHGVLIDVTDRIQAETALRESEKRFRSLFDGMSSGVAVYEAVDDGRDFVFRDFNQAGQRIESIRKEEVIGRRITEAFSGAEEFGLLAVMRRVWRTGEPGHHPVGFYEDDRIAGWRENFVYRLPSGEVVCIYDDVTGRKRADEALRESERRYRELYEGSRDGFGLVDMSGRIVECNTAFTKMTGYTKDELLRMTYEDITPPRWREFEGKIVKEQVLKRGFSDIYEKELQKKSGELFPVELRTHVIRELAGSVTGMWAFVRDVTARIAAVRARKELELRLRHSHKLQAVGQLAAGVAHDFNSLLTIILGHAELANGKLEKIRSDPTALSCSQHLSQILDSVEKGRSLIQQLLTFGRAQAWKPSAVDLDSIVGGMKRILDSALGRNVGLTLSLGCGECRIKGDPVQIEQVLMNLILNSRDAMPNGGEVAVKTRHVAFGETPTAVQAEALPGTFVRLTVTDTGTGIKTEDLERIFEPFFTTKFSDTGTGLGLSIVHGIVKQAGGHIDVKSEPGKGTSLSLYFPALE